VKGDFNGYYGSDSSGSFEGPGPSSRMSNQQPMMAPQSQRPPNPAGPSSTPLVAQAKARNNPATQQRAKRNRLSTSPGEQEGTSPKRPRPSPSGGDHPNPPGPPRNQPPMAPMVPFDPQTGDGPPGPQNMQNDMIRPPMNMAYQTMTGSASPTSPGIVSTPTPPVMISSPSSGSLSWPSPTPPPPKRRASPPSQSNHDPADLDSGSELSELTEDEQASTETKSKTNIRKQPTRRTRRSLIPDQMWG